MSRTPFARRKAKEEKLEELPVITMDTVVAPEQLEPATPTKSRLIIPDGTTDLNLRLQGTPEKTVSLETVEHRGAEETLRNITTIGVKLPVIRAPAPRAAVIPEEHAATPTQAATRDEIKLGEGDTTLWREAVRPNKKAEDK